MERLRNVTGTTRKRISRKNLGNVELQVPAKEEQKAVVEQLDCLVKIIDSRKKELQLLDNLIKARFFVLCAFPINWKLSAFPLPYCLLHWVAFIKPAQKAEIVTG